MNLRRAITTALTYIALMTLCIWPAIYNGQPLLFFDTTAYVRGADAGFARLTHHSTVWSMPAKTGTPIAAKNGAPEVAPQRKSTSSIEDKTVLAGRSVYYGALLYLGQLFGQFWPVILFQALLVLFSVQLTLETFGVFTLSRLALAAIVLAALTPMAFFVSYLMPDVFAAITILAAGNLLTAGNQFPFSTLISWTVLLGASLLFHTSHLLIALGMLAVGMAGSWLSKRPLAKRGILAICAAVFVAIGGEAVFNLAIKELVGAPPIYPPFVMARLIADGPGYHYLLSHCENSDLEVCKWLPKISELMNDPEHRGIENRFLWDSAKGVFAPADPSSKRKLASQQTRFLEATIAYDPRGVIRSWLRDSYEQLQMFSLAEFRSDGAADQAMLSSRVPEPYLSGLRESRVWRGTMPTQLMSGLTIASTIVSILLLGASLAIWRGSSARAHILFSFCRLVIAGVVVNAIVCGALSAPTNRYQSRVIWLFPLLALLSLEVVPWKDWRRTKSSTAFSPSEAEPLVSNRPHL